MPPSRDSERRAPSSQSAVTSPRRPGVLTPPDLIPTNRLETNWRPIWPPELQTKHRSPWFAGGSKWAGEDSNLRPTDYESAALTS